MCKSVCWTQQIRNQIGTVTKISQTVPLRTLYVKIILANEFRFNTNTYTQRKFLRVRRGWQASQRKGLTSGEVRETSGNFRGTSGEVWETSGEPLDCCQVPQWENFRGSRRKTSGEVWGTSVEVRGLPRSSGEPDPLPATRQICLQYTSTHRQEFKMCFRTVCNRAVPI